MDDKFFEMMRKESIYQNYDRTDLECYYAIITSFILVFAIGIFRWKNICSKNTRLKNLKIIIFIIIYAISIFILITVGISLMQPININERFKARHLAGAVEVGVLGLIGLEFLINSFISGIVE